MRVALLLPLMLACAAAEREPNTPQGGASASGGGGGAGVSGGGSAQTISACSDSVSMLSGIDPPFLNVVLPLAQPSFQGTGVVEFSAPSRVDLVLGDTGERLPISGQSVPSFGAVGDELGVQYDVFNPRNSEDIAVRLNGSDGSLLWFQYDGELNDEVFEKLFPELALTVVEKCDDPPDSCQSENRRLVVGLEGEAQAVRLDIGTYAAIDIGGTPYIATNFFARDKGEPAGVCADSRSGKLLSLQMLRSDLRP